MKIFILFVVALFLIAPCSAQREQGTWEDYLSYSNATKVAISPEKVYCLTDGGLFYFDLEDNSVNKLSDVVTLSDFGISTISYSTEKEILLIAYTNSNIDLLYEDGSIVNLPYIKNKSITGDKSINAISFSGSEAYLSCGFGIVALNLSKKEIKDTYYIGDDGASITVNDIAFDEEYIYAATDNGIYKALKTGTNLLDYNNWNPITTIPHSDDKFNHLVYHGGNIIANYTPEEWSEDQLYILNGDSWETYQSQIKYVHNMNSDGTYLTIASRSDLFIIDDSHTQIGHINSYEIDEEEISDIHPRSGGISTDGSIWMADYEQVLIRLLDEDFEQIFPNGPSDNDIYSLHHSESGLWISPGNTTGWETPRFNRYADGEWTYFGKTEYPDLDGFFNIVTIEVDPSDENHFFVGSWGGGLLEFKNDEFVQRYTNLNSPLETALPEQPTEPYVRIGGLDFDSDGNLWISNTAATNNLHKLTSSGEWESFSMAEVTGHNVGQLIVTEDNDKWILIPDGNDAYVVDETGDQIKQLLVSTYFSNGTDEYYTRMNDLYSIAEDQDGEIWIGSSKGVAVYSSPSSIWTSESFYGSQPGLDLDDGIYYALLETETVTAIAIDGANRKWLGTESSGAYLISESGDEELLHFTSDNSELLSDNITAIAINQETGEVFFGTDEGLISYQGEATEGNDSYSDVYVYPNPVRETYDGSITIAGLIANTDIKITDITGNLVYTTTSLGGQAIWDGTNLNGNRVKTGVYLIFCNDEYGIETHITKLLFIH
jgi:hypothetical protein